MSPLPRITELTRERIAREFDDLGPDACVAAIIKDLRQNNPELLDMAIRCAADLGDPAKIMMAFFGMFYRLLVAQSSSTGARLQINPLPRVTAETRETVLVEIDGKGPEAFIFEFVQTPEETNPELLQMTHSFASRQGNYLG